MPIVSDQEIKSLKLPLSDVYDLVVEGFTLHARGEFEMPPKIGIHTRPGAFMHAMPAYLPSKDLAGTKLVSVYPNNGDKGLIATTGIIAMMDPDTGLITCLLDAAWITKMRTAMVSMADVKWLANPDPVFSVLGATGVTGRAHLDAIASVFPGSRVLVNSRSPERLRGLREDFADAPLDITAADSHEAMVRDSDVVIVATSYLKEPILETEWLHPGQNVLNVHMLAWPTDFLRAADVVSCDDHRQVLDPMNGLGSVYEGLKVDVELGQVISGARSGRESTDQVIVSFNYGLAIFDLLVADRVLREI